jgi:beta-1,4-mannosyltransferase
MKILVFPKDPNPYQELLYKDMPKPFTRRYITWHVHKFSLLTAMPTLFSKMLIYRFLGFKIIHLHWTYPFAVPEQIPFSRLLTSLNAYLFLIFVKLLGYKLVWTIHNLMPHEQESLNDLKIIRSIVLMAGAIIAHSSQTIIDMKKLKISKDHVTVIPIGNYDNLYPAKLDKQKSRTQLGVKKTEVVILFFGLIRAYKGVDDLLVAFRALKTKNVRLIIAGNCDDIVLTKKILSMSQGLNVDFYDEFIPDDEVSKYFNAADIVCLPFKKVTTSSSILLAMSFKKATIAPRLGALNDIPDSAFIGYDPKDKGSLENALNLAAASPKLVMKVSKSGYEYSKSLSWGTIAKQTRDLFESL